MNKETIDKFFKAIKNNNIELVRLMLCSGMIDDVNIKNEYGSTALMLACSINSTEIATLLLSFKDIDVNAKNVYCYTALIWACYYNYIKTVKLLLSRKDIDVNIIDMYGETALSISIKNENKLMSRLLKSVGAKV